MAQAPETTGRVYGCIHGCRNSMTIAEASAHSKRFHPQDITTQRATPEQLAAGYARIAELRKALTGRSKR